MGKWEWRGGVGIGRGKRMKGGGGGNSLWFVFEEGRGIRGGWGRGRGIKDAMKRGSLP